MKGRGDDKRPPNAPPAPNKGQVFYLSYPTSAPPPEDSPRLEFNTRKRRARGDDDPPQTTAEKRAEVLDRVRGALAGHPMTMEVLGHFDGLEESAAKTANIVLKNMRGRIGDEELDGILAAHFTLLMDNVTPVARALDATAIRIVADFDRLSTKDTDEQILKKVKRFSGESKVLLLSTLIRGMDDDAIAGKSRPEELPAPKIIREQARYLQRISLIKGFDGRLMNRAMSAFNAVSLAARAPEALVRNNDDVFQIVMKRPLPKPGPKKSGPKPKG